MKRYLLLILLVGASITTQAQDRFFARTYTTNVLPKGAIDLEFWHTNRFGHTGQYFHAQDQRLEVEFGLGKNVQTAFYFNGFHTRFSEGSSETNTSYETGFSNEWKWKLSDPTANKLGVALYGEWGIKGGDELELETKIILDKNIGKSLIAFNGVAEFEKEFEWENNETRTGEWETPIELDLAYMYNFSKSFGLGLEVRSANGVGDEKGWQYSALYAGPTFNFRQKRFFIIANFQPQIGNLHKTDVEPFSKVLDVQERDEARLIFGISL